ncbi:MAG: 50S ribosomal protein L18Ae [Candidatus ainarchaeum sp.]|nr:50S ribosomal protein L18Ae [Candidatus ainarchaeum sp.]
MKKFEVKGEYKQKNEKNKFVKIINCKNQEDAKENVFSLIGGKQKIPRRNIKILEITEVTK